MAMKARFSSQQQPVKVVESDGVADVFICLNEIQGTEEYPDMGDNPTKEIYYEYDYNEICGPSSELPISDIQENPERYLDYSYSKQDPNNLEQRISALEQEQAQMNSIFEEVVNSEI